VRSVVDAGMLLCDVRRRVMTTAVMTLTTRRGKRRRLWHVLFISITSLLGLTSGSRRTPGRYSASCQTLMTNRKLTTPAQWSFTAGNNFVAMATWIIQGRLI